MKDKTDTKGNDAGELEIKLKEILSHHINGCICHEMYVKREMIDPNCFWCNDSDEIVIALKEAFELGKLSSPSTEGAAKEQLHEIEKIELDKICDEFCQKTRGMPKRATFKLGFEKGFEYASRQSGMLISFPENKFAFLFAKAEQLSEEKVLGILKSIFSISLDEQCIKAAKQICALSIPQPVSKELIKEAIKKLKCVGGCSTTRGMCKYVEDAIIILNNILSQQPEVAKEEAMYQNFCDCDNEMMCIKNCPARNQE